MNKTEMKILHKEVQDIDLSDFTEAELRASETIIDGNPCYLFMVNFDGKEAGYIVIKRLVV